MTGLIMAAQLILGLSILVTLHELGHYLAARAFGIKVEKFYLFFDAWGVKLFSFKRGETEFGVGWLPFGGYVKIAGMIDESLDKDQMASPPQPYEFRAKPAWQRLIVMVAGVAMNVILGIIIFSATLLAYKKEYLPNDEVKNGIYAYKLGEQIGLKNGDKILAIDGKEFERFDDLLSSRVVFGATLTVLRNGQKMEVEVPDNFYRTVAAEGRWNFIGSGEIIQVIKMVVPGENADKAGLQANDRIIAVNGKNVSGNSKIAERLAPHKNEKVTLTIKRDEEFLTLPVNVSEAGTIGIHLDTRSEIHESYRMK